MPIERQADATALFAAVNSMKKTAILPAIWPGKPYCVGTTLIAYNPGEFSNAEQPAQRSVEA
jgi:hypothetical protein